MNWRCFLAMLGAATAVVGPVAAIGAAPADDSGPARMFEASGRPSGADVFPIAVWLQNPRNAGRYKAAGINLYVGLWKGPTDAQLDALAAAGMPVICDQNAVALARLDNPVIAGWMVGDEPDNAQRWPEDSGKSGYGPPIPPEEVVAACRKLRAADPSRPVLLNLGQGVAWDDWIGRGTRTRHPEDYPEYVLGANIVSFDIYPANHDHPDVADKLEFVARGTARLKTWAGPERVVWHCVECTGINGQDGKPSPSQVRSEVWMGIIRGSRGLIYFVHQFKPEFREAALLDDAEMLAAVTRLNRRIHALAPVLNGPDAPPDAVSVAVADGQPAPSFLAKASSGDLWIFAANENPDPVDATFRVAGAGDGTTVEVLGEEREITSGDGGFADNFAGYGVHLYRVRREDAERE